MTLEVGVPPEIERWLLGWGEHVEVRAPALLRRALAQTAARMVRRYRGTADEAVAALPTISHPANDDWAFPSRPGGTKLRGWHPAKDMQTASSSLARLRSVSGIVIGLYVTMHLSNHALGLVSLQAQESARPYVMTLWHSLPGQVLLYGSFGAHAVCALATLAKRREFRMPVWELTQVLLGLAIPYLLLVHIVNTRGTRILTGIDINYPYEIANLWVDPWTRARQILLVALVWGHFVAGLHYWLRIQGWYRRAFPLILLFYVLVPAAALLGFAEVGMTTTDHARNDPAWMQGMKTLGVPADPRHAAVRAGLRQWVGASWLGVVALVFCAAQVRHWLQRHHRFRVEYPGGFSVDAPCGMSILEVSRMARQPHIAVCGGRARCTTCRVRVERTDGELPPPNALEAAALARIGAPAGLRLACQLRPTAGLAIAPLLHPRLAVSTNARAARGKEFGEERHLTILFVDLRGSTRLAEARMPYDVVFLLNRYFAEMAAAVEQAGGHYSNFTGDGLMALFGLDGSSPHGAGAALDCALRMLEKVDDLNEQMADELAEPFTVGIGIHTGPVIVGLMGPPKTPVLSALGDVVNTAARLESATKEMGVPVVVARDALHAAGMTAERPCAALLLRGRSSELPVCGFRLQELRELIGQVRGLLQAV